MRKSSIACVLLGLCSALPALAQLANGGVLPTEAEMAGISSACGSGNSRLATVKVQVDAAVKTWKSGAVGVEATVAKENLAGYLNRVKDDSKLEGIMKVYVDCIDRSLQRFLDREKDRPRPVSRTGSSGSLLRSSYASEEEIQSVGCGEAEVDAKRRVDEACKGRRFVAAGDGQCSRTGSSPRIYRVFLDGECRVE
jgi:hypothetical protein